MWPLDKLLYFSGGLNFNIYKMGHFACLQGWEGEECFGSCKAQRSGLSGFLTGNPGHCIGLAAEEVSTGGPGWAKGQSSVRSETSPLLQPSSMSVDLQGDSSLQVEISDAVSERDKVKFTVQTKSCLPHFAQTEFSVVRQHEEFIWLHDAYVENEEYAGLIIPPAPPRPDFEASREKLQKLGEGDSSITREEFAKMKQELEAEYLAIFKKTVAMHEVFLQRLAAHPTLRRDHNFFVFLEYGQDLSVRGKNRKELLGGFLRNIVKSADEALITGMSGLKEVDDFFEHERTFLLEYHTRIRDACLRADRVMRSHKCLADDFIPISAALSSLGTQEVNQLKTSFLKLAELFERLRKLEGRVASDEDLKLSDMLRYYMRDSQAAKDLLYRRLRALADYENANKALDKARTRNRENSWISSPAAFPLSARTSLSWQSWSSNMPRVSMSLTPHKVARLCKRKRQGSMGTTLGHRSVEPQEAQNSL
ncbi:sorting nexin-32 isoform X3 [Nycticebus coucang]|uniref:sorting nexin-32 isoform X3 n=1 Tax=Nycticebus coucang TaxID=9470 RepID=UPI00234D3B91|nr:sorting nexin-32 isoform X3 [Nycticebus coucang]